MHSYVRKLLRACAVVVAPAALGLVIASGAPALAAGGTSAGTPITNTATATYQDGSGTTYNSQSNTVTTTVQNAPALTIAPPSTTPGNQPVSPGGTVTDSYTLTNTGNGAGYFQLTGTQSTDDGVTAGQGTFTQYVVNVPGQTQQTFTTIAAVNAYLATGNTGGTPFTVPQAVGAPTSANQITIGVTYAANAGASGTITTKLTPDIIQPAGSGTTQQTSPTVLGQYNDTVVADARMDVQKIAAVGGTSAAPTVQYTVRYNNGGGRNMKAVNRNALPAGGGITGDGIVVTDKLPSYNAVQLTLSGAPAFVTKPTNAQFIYSTDGTTWTTTAAGAVYVGVFIPASSVVGGADATVFGTSNAGSSQNSVTAAQAELAFTFTINGSTASGSANASAITNVANSIFGDSSSFVEGPGIAYQTVSNSGTATAAQTAPAIANTNGTLTGSGQVTSAASPPASSVLNGPNGQPGATGPDTTTNTDYTAASYTNGNTLLSGVNGSTLSVPAGAAAYVFTNSVQNTGNKDDVYNLSAATGTGLTALPAGWTVTFQDHVTHATITTIAVASGTSKQYDTVFTPPAGATTFNTYVPYGDAVTATSQNDNTKSNVTNDEFFVGGFVKLVKSFTVAASQPCATASTFTLQPTALPSDCVQYTVAYTNVAPTGGTGNTTLNASSFVITEDGTASGGTQVAYTNNWATYTNGLYAAPVDSTGGALGGYSGGAAAGSTKFTDTVGTLAAGASGNVTFKAQVK